MSRLGKNRTSTGPGDLELDEDHHSFQPDLADVLTRARRYQRRQRTVAYGAPVLTGITLLAILGGAVPGRATHGADTTVMSLPSTSEASEHATTPGVKWPGEACAPPYKRGPSRRQIAATEKIDAIGMAKYVDNYTGSVRTCEPDRLIVFRKEPNTKFDRAIREIAERTNAIIEIRRAPASYSTMKAVSREAFARNTELMKHGAQVVNAIEKSEGYLRIGVTGDLKAARQILGDLEERDYVEIVPSAPVIQ